MNPVRMIAHIDNDHHLSVRVPDNIPPGPITIVLMPTPEEDDAGEAWFAGAAREWSEDLADARQDIYTLADGEPVDETR